MSTLFITKNIIYVGALIILAVMLMLCLLRAILGPRVTDRIVAVNMMGTMVMVMIVVLSLLLKEGFLVDICLIYAMVSFLAVVVISKVYIGVYTESYLRSHKQEKESRNKGGGADGNS